MESDGDGIEPHGPLRRLIRALDALATVCMAFAGVLLVVLIVIFGWLVFGRYVLNDTPTWVEQAALLIVVWVTFLGAAVGVWRNTHLSIDFIREAMPALPRTVLRLVAELSLAGFGVTLCWQGWLLTASLARRVMPMVGISEAWRAAPLVVSGALMALFAVTRLWLAVRSIRAGVS